MLEIDGSEGGGQILRTALGLSVLTGKDFSIDNIRAIRPQKGLREQHLKGVLAALELCEGEVAGAELGSEKIVFKPETIKSGELEVEINTAGSVGLLLQSLLIPTIKTDLKINVKGGATFGLFAPPIYHFDNVLFPLLKKMGYEVSSKVDHHGFFPKGGARIEVDSKKAELKRLDILDKGSIKSIKIISVASHQLENPKVAERQAEAAKKIIEEKFSLPVEVKVKYCDALCMGSGIQITIETENSFFGGDCVGERGKRAELVGEEAAKSLIKSYDNGSVDIHTGDMLLPYIALAGGSYIVPEITNHVKRNIDVIEKFLDIKFLVEGNKISVEKHKI
ncbi:RNA 3'-terminal phosphate cyclase [archaeon]|jgi:RNA 3'-phosphate cyclase|nr:RNA 3'-terminal phosphate cyclase [archaeon]MBT3731116.1 RNA 3'-terminal phosphate cyclase [archaeon]MBT4670229.1 RNA 3'-terminal phosphate cyclase [archaeon]MBT5030481.1 RNA 3'-terminal phosphate cyclase [archaeon]MBT5287834.1 RNA 3'-terminal phosphate cyclase [archaeon]